MQTRHRGLCNPDCLLLFFLMKQPRLWFYGHSWVWERHRSACLLGNRLVEFFHSELLLFSSFIPSSEFFLHSSAMEKHINGTNKLKMKSLTLSLMLVTSSHMTFYVPHSGSSYAVLDVCLFSRADIPKHVIAMFLMSVMDLC